MKPEEILAKKYALAKMRRSPKNTAIVTEAGRGDSPVLYAVTALIPDQIDVSGRIFNYERRERRENLA